MYTSDQNQKQINAKQEFGISRKYKNNGVQMYVVTSYLSTPFLVVTQHLGFMELEKVLHLRNLSVPPTFENKQKYSTPIPQRLLQQQARMH